MAARPEEISITRWFDALFAAAAKQADVTVEDYTVRVGSEGIAAGIEIPIDLFMSQLGAKITKGVIGLASLLYATFGKPPSKRLQSELLEIGSHWTFEILDPKPGDIMELLKDADKLAARIKAGDVVGALQTFIRSPEEIKALAATLGARTTPTVRTQTKTVTAPRVEVKTAGVTRTQAKTTEEGEEF